MPQLKPLKKKDKSEKIQVRSNGVKVKNPTSKSCWSGFEREASALIGTVRVPLSGGASRHNTSSDSLSLTTYLECKVRAKSAVHELFIDTEDKAKFEKKTPLVAIKKKGARGYLLVMRPEDVEKIAEEIKKARENLDSNEV